MRPIFSTTPTINKIIGLALIGVGAAGIGLQAQWFSERSNYVSYSGVVTDITGIKTVGTSLDVAVAGAAIVIIGGAIALLSAFSKSEAARRVFIAALLIAAIGGIVELAGGVTVSTSPYLKAIGPETYVYNENRPAEVLEGDQSKMSLFGQAVFEKCCRVNSWASLGAFGPCGVACPSDGSGKIIDTRISLFTSGLDVTDLCTCVRPAVNSTYDQYMSAIGQTHCDNLKKITVTFNPDLNIPTTCEKYHVCLSLGTIKSTLYASSSIVKVPLVGYQLNAESSNGLAAPGFGFGCGLGYQKGVMWMQEIYHDQVIRPSGSNAIGLGVAAVAIVAVTFLLGFFLSREDKDMGEGQWEPTLAATWNDPKAGGAPAPAPAAIPVAKVENGWTAPPVSAYQVNANDFTDQLIKFYSKHDPEKTQKEIENISAWGKQNGLAALNKKLKDKYGVDLSSDQGPPI